MKYRLLPVAQQDMREIDDWVVEKFGQQLADRTQHNLYGTFELLSNFPGMGIVRPGTTRKSIRFFHLKPYWIAYEPGDPFFIHRIYHAARDLHRLKLR